jgi:hypothetical protein
VDKITKAAKRLYLKQLKRSSLSDNDLKCFYIASIRSILEYACMSSISLRSPGISSDQIERIQKRALRIVCPDLSYSEAIEELYMETLKTRGKDYVPKSSNQ